MNHWVIDRDGNHAMSSEIVTAGISALGGLLIAAVSYVFTKKKERDAEWRKEKLGYYKSFVRSLSGATESESSPEGKKQFAVAVNDLMLFAPQKVIEALSLLLDEIKVSNPNKSQEKHDELLSRLMFEIRKDLGVKPNDDLESFRVTIWASGVKSRKALP